MAVLKYLPLHFTWIPEVENAHSLFCIATVTVQSGKFVVILNRAKLFRQKSFVHIDLLKRNSIYLKVVKKKFLYNVYIWASPCPEEWNVVAGPRIMLGFPWWLCPDNTDNTLTHTHMTRYTHLHTLILVNALEFPTYSKCCPVEEIVIGNP